MIAAQGSLTLLNVHTDAPEVYWNGVLVTGVQRVHVHNDEDEHRVKLVITGGDDSVVASMLMAGIQVRRVV